MLSYTNRFSMVYTNLFCFKMRKKYNLGAVLFYLWDGLKSCKRISDILQFRVGGSNSELLWWFLRTSVSRILFIKCLKERKIKSITHKKILLLRNFLELFKIFSRSFLLKVDKIVDIPLVDRNNTWREMPALQVWTLSNQYPSWSPLQLNDIILVTISLTSAGHF